MEVPECFVYPTELSTAVDKLEYPYDFNLVVPEHRVIPFIPQLDDRYHIVYHKLDLEEKYVKHLADTGKVALTYNKHSYKPHKIAWHSVYKKLRRPVDARLKMGENANAPKKDSEGKTKKNVDSRTGFRYDNKYLVKTFFTFGQRKVQENHKHVIQTTNVPILIYYVGPPNPKRKIIHEEEKIFLVEDQFLYEKKKLPARGCYVLPPGSVYVILTIQKTLFSLDVVSKDLEIELEWKNPITEVFDPDDFEYDRPVETPAIDDGMREIGGGTGKDEDSQVLMFFESGQGLTEEMLMPPPPPPQMIPPSPKNPVSVKRETFIMSPPMEKVVQIVSPNFVNWYQAHKYKEYSDPRIQNFFRVEERGAEEEEEPMDLTMPPEQQNCWDFFLNSNVDAEELDRLLSDLSYGMD